MGVIALALFINGGERTIQAEQYLGWYADLEDQDEGDQARIIADKVKALPEADLAAAVVMGAVETLMGCTWTTDAQVIALAKLYGIDVLAVRDKVAEDLNKQQQAPALEDEQDEEAVAA